MTDYSIDIKGLALGVSTQEFKVGKDFFKSYDNDTITDADLTVSVTVNKSSGWIKVDCNIAGNVDVECDRCLAELRLPINISAPFTVKFSSIHQEEGEYGDDVIVLDSTDAELDLSQIIYDYVCLSLPLKRVHPDGECDPVMLEKMKTLMK